MHEIVRDTCQVGQIQALAELGAKHDWLGLGAFLGMDRVRTGCKGCEMRKGCVVARALCVEEVPDEC